MNQGQGHTGGGSYSWFCQMCGQIVLSGQAHACGWQHPFPAPMQPTGPACRAPYMPLTIEDIRKVIREELDRKPDRPSDNGLPQHE